MKKFLIFFFLLTALIAPLACTHGPVSPKSGDDDGSTVTNTPTPTSTTTPHFATSTPTPTPMTYACPTTTPGCTSIGSIFYTQYTYPNPTPTATPVGTPVVVTSLDPYVDSLSHGGQILRSLSDWTTFWTDLGLAVPPPPTDFSTKMIFVQGTYGMTQVCYTSTNVIIYQDYVTGGMMPNPYLTPVPTPTTSPHYFLFIPASCLPVSFISTSISGE